MKIKSNKFNFKNDNGEVLSGRLELPYGQIKSFAIFAHCFTCSKNISASSRISKKLAQLGIGVLRFDFTGLGNSDGDFENTNFSSNIADLICAYNALKEDYKAPSILIGHSFGGAAVLKASKELEAVKAVITIAAPSDTKHVAHLFEDELEEIDSKGEAEVCLENRKFKIKKQFIEDLSDGKILDGISETKKAYLIMHSPFDNIVSVDHASHIFKALKHPKSFITLDTIDHLVSKPNDAEYIAEQINSWVKRYLAEDDIFENKSEGKGVIVESRSGSKFTHDITSNRHYLIADEPTSMKGDDLGMSPYELLLSALGACTSMTMKLYAQRKGFDLKNVKVDLKHEKNDGVDHFFKEISLFGDLSESEKERILAIAKKCPVHKTLDSEVTFKSELKAD